MSRRRSGRNGSRATIRATRSFRSVAGRADASSVGASSLFLSFTRDKC